MCLIIFSFPVAKAEADRLFNDVLERKDKADGTRNALGVMQRFRFLFHLPASLERNIKNADYDMVINDYARAKALFGDSEVQVFPGGIFCFRRFIICHMYLFPRFIPDI